jgi:hypothetical protein
LLAHAWLALLLPLLRERCIDLVDWVTVRAVAVISLAAIRKLRWPLVCKSLA